MGENKWRDEDSWPLERAKPTQLLPSLGRQGQQRHRRWRAFYLSRCALKAQTCSSTTLPTPFPPSAARSAATRRIWLPARAIRNRSKPVLMCWSTPRRLLESDMEVTGPSHSRLIRNFFCRRYGLYRQVSRCLRPNGFAQNLTEGILRASFRESTTAEPKLIVPGKVYEYKIDLWSTSNVFLKGHRIRLEVSSSNFPRFDRNLNTGKLASTSASFVKATNTILHDKSIPARCSAGGATVKRFVAGSSAVKGEQQGFSVAWNSISSIRVPSGS